MNRTPVNEQQNQPSGQEPERLPQRWGLILIGAFVAGAAFCALGGLQAGLVAAGGAVVGLHKVLA